MKNKKLFGVAGLAAVLAVGGSLAYFNQTMTVENPFKTSNYSSELVETFTPKDGDNWQPGATVNKDIQVDNTGDYDVIVRVKFDETWTKKGDNVPYKTNIGIDNSTSQVDPTDGLLEKTENGVTTKDGSVVQKNLVNTNNWFYNKADGYWYYLTNVKAGESTGKFLDNVKLIDDADMGKYDVVKYYTTADTAPAATEIGTTADDPATKWVPYEKDIPSTATHTKTVTKLDENAPGYSDSDYKLTITAQTVQASKDAVNKTFDLTSVTGSNWTLAE